MCGVVTGTFFGRGLSINCLEKGVQKIEDIFAGEMRGSRPGRPQIRQRLTRICPRSLASYEFNFCSGSGLAGE